MEPVFGLPELIMETEVAMFVQLQIMMFVQLQIIRYFAKKWWDTDAAGIASLVLAAVLLLSPFWVPVLSPESLAAEAVNMSRYEEAAMASLPTVAEPVETPDQIYVHVPVRPFKLSTSTRRDDFVPSPY